MASFNIDGVDYETRMMDGEVWPLVLKRLLPVVTSIVGVADDLKAQFPADADEAAVEPIDDEADGDAVESPNARMARIAMPVAQRLASMKDADIRFVLDACMDVTRRRIGGAGWVPVRQNGVFQHQADARYMTKFAIAWHVLSENAADMFSRLGLDMNVFRAMIPPGFNG